MINFEVGEDLKLVQDTIHEFSLNEVREIAREAEKIGKVPESLEKKYAELSMFLIDYPENVGGAGMDVRSSVVLYEELAWGDPAIALSLDTPGFGGLVIRFFGTDEQKVKYLSPFSDPSNFSYRIGSVWNRTFDPYDTESVTVRYVSKGGKFFLNGTGYFVHNFDNDDIYVVLALPEGSEDLKELRVFIVKKESPGITTGRKDDKIGLLSFRTGVVEFKDVEAEVLSGSQDPVKSLEESYIYFWLRIASMILGASRAALEYAIDYAQERVAFGQPIAKHQGLAFMISDMAILLEGARDYLWETAWSVVEGKASIGDVAAALAQIAVAADKICPDAIQVLGGHGYIMDHPVEKWARDAKALSLLAGSLIVFEDVASNYIVKENGGK